MATATLSGYHAAAASVAWAAGRSIESLASLEFTDLSDAIDNSTNKYLFADIEIVLASVAFTGTGSIVEIYLIPSVDGTNYPTWTGDGIVDEQENNAFFVGAVTTTGTTAAQRMTLRNVALPNGLYKYALRNRTGIAFTTGNTMKWRPHGYSSTA